MRRKTVSLIVGFVVCVLSASSAAAQGRRPGRFWHPRPVVYFGAYHPFHPFFFDQWYPPIGIYPPYGVNHADRTGNIRLQVTPEQAEVYVDGFLAGTVDDFDGVFQRLSVWPGQHEIVLYLDGYRAVQQNIFVTPGKTFRIRSTMAPLAPGEINPARPQAPIAPRAANAPYAPNAAAPPYFGGFGHLQIRVQPVDAAVFIDGEQWQGPHGPQGLVVQVSAGPHSVEVRRDGYETFGTQVQVRSGEAATVNVSLPALDRTR